MAKTAAPAKLDIPNGVGKVVANAVPDPFDERDLIYRPRLEPLPPYIDQRDQENKYYFVLEQSGSSCTGHAVAAVINTVRVRSLRSLAEAGDARAVALLNQEMQRASPYMLYHLARIFDEFQGQEETGSSLRGAFKGWFHHGVCMEQDWPALDSGREFDLDAPDFVARCREVPLGAYFRVNPLRLDDMQSAIAELKVIAVSASIHEGWIAPVVVQKGSESMYIIRRPRGAAAIGGHAFVLVGYNEVGFLVQNSWGPNWGKKGFATLPYEDWLDNAYDAWVARPGVPQTPFAVSRSLKGQGTRRESVLVPDIDLVALAKYVVNLGNEGQLSTAGKFRSSPTQVDALVQHMQETHNQWVSQDTGQKRHIMLFAHGGVSSEQAGLKLADSQRNWWLNNHVYPVFFAWESGAIEVLFDHIKDLARGRMPAGAIGLDLVEQFDRLIENISRQTIRWEWDEMKENARAASNPIAHPEQIAWPPAQANQADMLKMPGAALFVDRLRRYVAECGVANVAIHLVCHSAGSVFHSALLQRLVQSNLPVETFTLLAPALRVDDFQRDVLPHVQSKKVKRLAVFDLSEKRELDDTCTQFGVTFYYKSLVYLVARALERPARGRPGDTFEVPLLGLQASLRKAIDGGQTIEAQIKSAGGEVVYAPQGMPANSRSQAKTHGNFTNDPDTMNSVMMRILDVGRLAKANYFQSQTPVSSAAKTDDPLLGILSQKGWILAESSAPKP